MKSDVVPYLDASHIAERVSNLLNLSIGAEPLSNSGSIAIRVVGLDRPHGFSVEVSTGLSFVYATLKLDSLARPLLETLSQAPHGDWLQFFETLAWLRSSGILIDLKINGAKVSAPPVGGVESLTLGARLPDKADDGEASAADLGASLMALLLALLPLDDPNLDDGLEHVSTFAEEGQLSRVDRNHYERSRSNRALAIIAHGTRCIVCEFDYGQAYGEFGEGYVEIHHLTPVHLMEKPRVVNPLEELVPLCANCHRMVHRVDPPLSPETLRGIYSVHGGASRGLASMDTAKA